MLKAKKFILSLVVMAFMTMTIGALTSCGKDDDIKIIGYGRIIGDGICFLYIHDVMVIPKYQNKKIR